MVKRGFTLVELILVMGIIALLLAIGSFGFANTYSATSLTSATDLLQSDLKTQQSSAMGGLSGDSSLNTGWGIKFYSDHYIQFTGSTFNSSDPANISTELPTSVTISTSLPSDTIVFDHASGEFNGYTAGNDSVTISNGSTSHTITLNQYGTIISN